MNRQDIVIETLNGDLWQRVPGNEALKRALEVALAGPHPAMILYYPEVRRPLTNLVRALYETFDDISIKPAPICPCGYYQHRSRACSCTAKEIRHYYKQLRLHIYHIIIQSAVPRVRDFLKPGERFVDVEARILGAIDFKKDKKTLHISSEALTLLETAYTKLSINPENVFQVADTIAALDRTTTVGSSHLAEAIQYSQIPHA